MRSLAVLLVLLIATALLAACNDVKDFVATVVPEATVSPEPAPDIPDDGSRPSWDKTPHYCIVPDDIGFVPVARFEMLVQDAFRTWGVAAVDDGACNRPASNDDDVSEIGFGQTSGNTPEANEAGETIVTWTRCRGCSQKTITEADITIDIDPPRRFANERCLFTTVLHETGHFLGLGHLDDPAAIMAPVKSNCPQELTDADRQALAELYA